MKQLLKEIRPYVRLYRDTKTGIAWVEDGSTGCGGSCHPNIHATGSIRGMKKLGFWRKNDRAVRSHGFIYNVDSLVISDKLDQIAADHCRCVGCLERRSNDQDVLLQP